MAETLLAILLTTSSAKGASIVYRWPPSPAYSSRLCRPRPGENAYTPAHLDNPWRASHFGDAPAEAIRSLPKPFLEPDSEYQWKRPDAGPLSYSSAPSHPSSGRASPAKDGRYSSENSHALDEYGYVFGYSAEFLASLVCPQRSMCHQKFELLVDDLAFIGHPVCAEEDGSWRFKREKARSNPRGRETRNSHSHLSQRSESTSPDMPSSPEIVSPDKGWLDTFNFVLILDIPDPSSSASGNVSKYFDVIYEQIAFTITAVLFQEQVLSNYVEAECETLGSLKDSCISKGESFLSFAFQALEVSSIASAMKTLYEAIKTSNIAYVTIHNLPLEVQLPPYLDLVLLHDEGDTEPDFSGVLDQEYVETWGQDMQYGWRLPSLTPWKSLLLLDGHDGSDPPMDLKGVHVKPEDRTLVDGLIRFLETASITLSLADMATLLDWDLESQIMPTVRWLVQHRRAKVVDIVHVGLKTVFTLPTKFDRPLDQLTAEFDSQFSHPAIPSLPRLLSKISSSLSKQSDNHFFASVVQSKELIPMYHDVIVWMLKRDMLITLHLRVRIIASRELKMRVSRERKLALARKASTGKGVRKELQGVDELDDLDIISSAPSMISRATRDNRFAGKSRGTLDNLDLDLESDGGSLNKLDDDLDTDGLDSGWDSSEDQLSPSIIHDPGRATPLQRRWLASMSQGKEPRIAKRFQYINQYFDGKKTDDEILYRAEITRKQLREVLHHYEEYLQTFLHPS